MRPPSRRDEDSARPTPLNRATLKRSLYLLCGIAFAAASALLAIYAAAPPRTGAARWLDLVLLVQLAACAAAGAGLRLLCRAGARRGGAAPAPAPPRDDAGGEVLLHRIRYHFLFNTLNATISLIKPHPELAEANLGNLSEIFRMMLFQETQTSLAEEIRMAQCYVEMERLRLGDRLRVEWRLDCGDTARIRVPSIMLQPLIENAIYHGVETRVAGGTVRVAVTGAGRRLVFDIRNPVNDGGRHRRRGNRVARNNIRLRLAQAYGGDFVFDDERRTQEYRVKINIPLEKENDTHTNRG
ncbi:MAG: histidine kinase [Gammaproteobacteria bacterium]|nr:histidine kinase [Gammaproteobacteria bacterium]MDD9869834.1 histidine kinase [Gammaproteobacteria bacterium]